MRVFISKFMAWHHSHKKQKDNLVEIDFKAILANFCCYGYGANASEAVQIVLDPFHLQGPQQAFDSINQSIYTMSGSPKKNICKRNTLELYANSLKQLIL